MSSSQGIGGGAGSGEAEDSLMSTRDDGSESGSMEYEAGEEKQELTGLGIPAAGQGGPGGAGGTQASARGDGRQEDPG